MIGCPNLRNPDHRDLLRAVGVHEFFRTWLMHDGEIPNKVFESHGVDLKRANDVSLTPMLIGDKEAQAYVQRRLEPIEPNKTFERQEEHSMIGTISSMILGERELNPTKTAKDVLKNPELDTKAIVLKNLIAREAQLG